MNKSWFEELKTKPLYGMGATSRTDFTETWLLESPLRIPPTNFYPQLCSDIEEFIKYGKDVIELNNGLKKIVMGDGSLLYWIEDASGKIQIGIELDKRPQGMIVRLLGKDPSLTKSTPYASDLYISILNDIHGSIKMMSDDKLTDKAASIWKKLFSNGFVVTVYDSSNPGDYHTLHNSNEFDNFFGNSMEMKKYQFILSDPSFIAETRSYFHLRRIRELSGLGID